MFLNNFRVLPLRVKRFLPFLIQSRRLESYATEKGLYKALELMAHYTSLPGKQDFALATVKEKKYLLLAFFYNFMDEIIHYVEKESGIKIKKPDVGNY
ncbi:MAG: DUF479 domain-containing protein [Prolixibacteraceae bacterium]|nr:DUF479 domain-containing protein [Prolixibacteraceae bacterium]